jgi:sugar lactone lactonase YvrE
VKVVKRRFATIPFIKPLALALVQAFACAVALAQQPRIDRLSPDRAPIAGGTIVSIVGANLAGASVLLDNTAIVPLSQTASEIRLSMPQHDSGLVVVSVRNAEGTAYAEFLYIPPPLDAIAPGFITTVAGIGNYVRDFGKATSAVLGGPSGLAFGRNGVLFVAEPLYGKLDRVNPDGSIERITHIGGPGQSSGDGGPAIDATVSFPTSIATDSAGNIYIPDHNYRIRRIAAATGIITSIAGDGTQGYTGDGGPATAARIGVTAYGAAVSGNDFYFIDFDAMRIRRIDLQSGIISACAGNGPGDSGDGGPALNAKFDVGDSDRGGLAADRNGNLYLGDSVNGRLRRIDRATGIISTVAAAPQIRPVTVDADDNIYYGAGGSIVKLASDGHVLDKWGGGPFTALPPDGAPAHGSIAGLVTGLAIDDQGNIVYSDASVGRVRRINIATQTIETIAGIGPAIIGENGPAIASLISPTDLERQSDGSILFGDATLRLRRLDRNGNVTTVAGSGMNGGPSYDIASRVSIAAVGIESDDLGNVAIADSTYVRQLRPDGVVAPLVSRNPNCGYAGDGGLALDASVCQVWDTARDGHGHLFVADTNNNRIRRVDAQTGVISTVIGNGATDSKATVAANSAAMADWPSMPASIRPMESRSMRRAICSSPRRIESGEWT